MNVTHYLCSHLVALRNYSTDSISSESIVNLEEIWSGGAFIESEEPIAENAKVEMQCGSATLTGRIVRLEPHEFGWRCEMEFSPLTPWTLERFRPDHLLDPAELKKAD